MVDGLGVYRPIFDIFSEVPIAKRLRQPASNQKVMSSIPQKVKKKKILYFIKTHLNIFILVSTHILKSGVFRFLKHYKNFIEK